MTLYDLHFENIQSVLCRYDYWGPIIVLDYDVDAIAIIDSELLPYSWYFSDDAILGISYNEAFFFYILVKDIPYATL